MRDLGPGGKSKTSEVLRSRSRLVGPVLVQARVGDGNNTGSGGDAVSLPDGGQVRRLAL